MNMKCLCLTLLSFLSPCAEYMHNRMDAVGDRVPVLEWHRNVLSHNRHSSHEKPVHIVQNDNSTCIGQPVDDTRRVIVSEDDEDGEVDTTFLVFSNQTDDSRTHLWKICFSLILADVIFLFFIILYSSPPLPVPLLIIILITDLIALISLPRRFISGIDIYVVLSSCFLIGLLFVQFSTMLWFRWVFASFTLLFFLYYRGSVDISWFLAVHHEDV